MATSTCDDCGGPLGKSADTCPNCGKSWTNSNIDDIHADIIGIKTELIKLNPPSGSNAGLDARLDAIYERLDKLTTYVGWFWWLLIGIPLIAGIVFLILAIIKENQ